MPIQPEPAPQTGDETDEFFNEERHPTLNQS